VSDNNSTAQNNKLRTTVLWMVLINGFATPLMLSATNVALPAIAQDLHLSAIQLSWIPMAYLMACAMSVLLFGNLADRFGRKKVFLIGTAAVIVTSALGAFAVTGTMLVVARFLQGIASAMLYATQIAIVTSAYPAHKRGKVLGIVVSVIYIGLSVGPLIGGYLIDAYSWHATFLMQIPLALVVLALGITKVPVEWRSDKVTPFDYFGAISYSVGIFLICLAVAEMPSTLGLALFTGALFVLFIFVRHSLTTAHPFWNVRLFFSNRVFAFSNGASLLMYCATYSNIVLLSLYLQYLKGFPATTAGMLLMVQPFFMAVLAPITGRLSDNIEPRLLSSSGVAVTAIGLFLMAGLNESSSIGIIVFSLAITGTGFSLFSPPNVNAIMGSVDTKDAGIASSAMSTIRLMGQLTSMVIVSLMLGVFLGDSIISPSNYASLGQAIHNSFIVAALLCIPGIALSLSRGSLHKPKNTL